MSELELLRLRRLKENAAEEIHFLHATIEQQTAWLREITTERDALRLRVVELEQELRLKQVDLHCVISANEHFQARVRELEEMPLKKCPNCDYPSWTCRRCGHWE